MIRQVEHTDAPQLSSLLKSIDNSGFMLFEPGERETSNDGMLSFINTMLQSTNSNCFVAEKNGMAAIGGSHQRTKHSLISF